MQQQARAGLLGERVEPRLQKVLRQPARMPSWQVHELDGDSQVKVGPVAVCGDDGDVEASGECEAGAVGERESPGSREGS